jgi:hypothetical protein
MWFKFKYSLGSVDDVIRFILMAGAPANKVVLEQKDQRRTFPDRKDPEVLFFLTYGDYFVEYTPTTFAEAEEFRDYVRTTGGMTIIPGKVVFFRS